MKGTQVKPYICSYIGLGASGSQNNTHSINMNEDNIVIVMGWPFSATCPD